MLDEQDTVRLYEIPDTRPTFKQFRELLNLYSSLVFYFMFL